MKYKVTLSTKCTMSMHTNSSGFERNYDDVDVAIQDHELYRGAAIGPVRRPRVISWFYLNGLNTLLVGIAYVFAFCYLKKCLLTVNVSTPETGMHQEETL